MDMRVLFLLCVQYFAFTSSTVSLDIPLPVVSVKESEGKQVELTPSPDKIKCSDTNGDLTRAFITAISPPNPRQAGFQILPCGPPDEDFCLVFMPSMGSLNFKSVSSYILTIQCTDDKDPPENASIEVRIIGNNPPRFSPATPYVPMNFDATKGFDEVGTAIRTVTATDDEGDAIYFFMSVTPIYFTKYFDIGYTSGIIHCKVDMRMLCEDTVSFSVSIMDPYHDPGPPKVVQVTLIKRNVPPLITTSIFTATVAEDKGIDSEVFKFDVTDATVYVNNGASDNVSMSMVSNPAAGLDVYKVEGRRILVRRPLNYEYEPLRVVKLTLQAFDGFCYSDIHTIEVTITDVNEPFILQPDFFQPVFPEGLVSYYPPLKIIDPDVHDTHIFRRLGGSSLMILEATTGRVNSISVLDVEPKDSKNFAIEIQVEDDGNHKKKFEVNTTVQDINDNAPVFGKSAYDMKIDNCTGLGKVIDKTFGKDDDSEFQGNNVVYMTGGGAHFKVMADGSVVYTSLMQVGDVDTASVFIHDQGQVPGPLTGLPAVVSVTCELCPPPPTPKPTKGPNTPTTTSIYSGVFPYGYPTGGNSKQFFSENVAWISGAGVAGAALIGLVTYMACRLKKPRALTRNWPKTKTTERGGIDAAKTNGPTNKPAEQGPKTKQPTAQGRAAQNKQITHRSPIPEIKGNEPIMHVAARTYPQYFQETDLQVQKPQENQATKKAQDEKKSKEKKDKVKDKDKATKDKHHSKKKTEKPPQPVETSRKPKMEIPTDSFDLDIITPRGNVVIA